MSVKQTTPQDAWKILKEDKNSLLIDVRTYEELRFVGFVDLSSINAKSVILPWRIYPEMNIDQNFADKLSNFISKTFPNSSAKINLLFICLGGGRSHDAAVLMSDFGYDCHNIIGGFEGELDAQGHRGNINGWKAQNLPWGQK